MNLVSGNRLWVEVNPILYKYPYLSEDIECEIAVMGAGVIGAICAYYLTEAGINTVLVDKNIIGLGSTSASTSLLQYEVDYDLIELQGKIGLENAIKSFRLCEKAVYDIERIINTLNDKCDFTLRECFYYTDKESDIKQIKKEFDLRKEYGFDVEFLDKKTASEKFSFTVEAGIFSKSGAGEIDPYRFAHGLIATSINKGLQVYENTEISAMNNYGDYLILDTNKNKKIKAKKVIISTGFEGRNYIKEKIATLNRTYTMVTKPVDIFTGWYNRCLIRDNQTPYTYLRTTGDNRIIIGGEDSKIGGSRSKLAEMADTEEVLKQKFNIIKNKLLTHFPEIPIIETEYEFTGLFGETKDGLPYIGEYKELPNRYFSLCYGSNGILYGILAGQLLRDLYLGNPSPVLNLFRFGR